MDSAPREIRVLLVSEHAMLREAIQSLIGQEPDLRVVGEAATAREALAKAGKLAPDILLLSQDMADLSCTEVLYRLAKDAPSVRTLILADSNGKRQIVEALKHGARGVVSVHSTAQLLFKGIRAAAMGEYWVGHANILDIIDCLRTETVPKPQPSSPNGFNLTPRESEVMELIVDGCTNKDIAHKFGISEQTVKHHLTSVFEKTGVSNRLELALLAMQEQVALSR